MKLLKHGTGAFFSGNWIALNGFFVRAVPLLQQGRCCRIRKFSVPEYSDAEMGALAITAFPVSKSPCQTESSPHAVLAYLARREPSISYIVQILFVRVTMMVFKKMRDGKLQLQYHV